MKAHHSIRRQPWPTAWSRPGLRTQRLSAMHPDTAEAFAEWGDYRLAISRTHQLVGNDVERTGDVRALGFLTLQIEHVLASGGLPPFLETVVLPDPVMDQLCRYWLNLRADESDLAEGGL